MTELVVAAGGQLYFQLVVHVTGARNAVRDFPDETFFLGGVNRAAQRDLAIFGDDLHVLGIYGHVFPGDDFFANLRCGIHVGLAVALVERGASQNWRRVLSENCCSMCRI